MGCWVDDVHFLAQIMKNLEAVHFMLNEMVMNGCIVETNKQNIMAPIMLMDKYTQKGR